MSASWKITLPCTRDEAEALNIEQVELSLLDPPPVLLTQEVEAFNAERWELIVYFQDRPSAALTKLVQSLVPSAQAVVPQVELVPDEDWVTMSQSAIAPTQAGRFFVHTGTNADAIPQDAKVFQIAASQAFGTGGHETTAGCLAMLDAMKRRGAQPSNIADIGTGTGLLAFAARHLWPTSRIIATDIDPVCIDIVRQNALVNHVAIGPGRCEIATTVAAGLTHRMIRQRAPYDLIIANILAGPLVDLAPAFQANLRDGGSLLLAGLIESQLSQLVMRYRDCGFRIVEVQRNGDWPCVRLIKRRQIAWQRKRRKIATSLPMGSDFGGW